MGYEINAIVAERGLLEGLAREHAVPVVALRHGFALVPLTRPVIDTLVAGSRSAADATPERTLTDVLQTWSDRGPIIHVTSEVHAGVGEQDAQIWQGGNCVFAQSGSPYSGPASMALQRLGVQGGRLGWDEFDIVGLGMHRRTEGWLKAATDATQ